MITLEELYNKVMSDRNIMKEFVKASSNHALSVFAEKHECIATERDIRNYFILKCEGRLDDDDVGAVTGGTVIFEEMINDIYNMKFGGDDI